MRWPLVSLFGQTCSGKYKPYNPTIKTFESKSVFDHNSRGVSNMIDYSQGPLDFSIHL